MDRCSVCNRTACRCDVPTGGVDEDDPFNPVDLTAKDWREIMSDPDYPDDDQEP